MQTKRSYSYDVCLSFAGEDRKYVSEVAQRLRSYGIDVFFDEFEEASLWGADLYEHLDYIYSKACRYCVIFCSSHYAQKLWTNHERRSAQARAFEENEVYLLPARFDGTEIPGVRKTTGYIDLKKTKPDGLAKLILGKVGKQRILAYHQRTEYLPADIEQLYKAIAAVTPKQQLAATLICHHFFHAVKRMKDTERSLLFSFFAVACPHDLPNNLHIEMDLLRRVSGLTSRKIRSTMGRWKSLGFEFHCSEKADDLLYGSWHVWSEALAKTKGALPNQEFYAGKANFTGVAAMIVSLIWEHYCFEHGREMFVRANFSPLSSSSVAGCDHSDRET